MRILIIEDNEKLAGYLREALEERSFAVDWVADGETGEQRALSGRYDLVILDLLLPKRDGVTVCKSLREQDMNAPVIMLTARGDVEDRVEGLDAGADDYMIKPFELAELLARVRALLRRPTEKSPEKLAAQDVVVDNARHTVEVGGTPLALTVKEYAVLEYLVRNKGLTVTREQILDHCWDFAYDSFSNIVDVYIKQLRKKLGDKDEKYITTVRGVGYQFQE